MKYSKFKQNITNHSNQPYKSSQCNTSRPMRYFKSINSNEQLIKIIDLNKVLINTNSCETMDYFFHNKNQINSKDEITTPAPKIKKQLHFDSNKIASKEMTLLKNRQLNGFYMEALVNKSIDLTVIPNTTILSKSLLDLSMIQSSRDNGSNQKSNVMCPMYSSSKDNANAIIRNNDNINGINSNSNRNPSTMKSNANNDIKSTVAFIFTLNESKNVMKNEQSNKDTQRKNIIKSSLPNNDNDNYKKDYCLIEKNKNVKKSDNADTNDNDAYYDNYYNDYHNNNHSLKEDCINDNSPIQNDKTKIIFLPKAKVESNSKNHDDIEPEEESPPMQYNQYNQDDNNHNNNIFRSSKKKETLVLTDHHLYITNNHDPMNINENQYDYNENEDNEPHLLITEPIKPEESENLCNLQQNSQYQEKTNRIYHYKPVTTLNDIYVKNTSQHKDPCQHYHTLIKKYFHNQIIDPNHHHSLSSSDVYSQNQSNISNLSYIDKDSKEIAELKSHIIRIHQHCLSQINHLQYEIAKLEEAKICMDESVENKASSTSLPLFSKQDKLRLFMEQLEKIDASMNLREKNDKKTIKKLLNEFKLLLNNNSNNSDEDKILLREANDFIEDDNDEVDFPMKLRRRQDNNNNNDNSCSSSRSNTYHHHHNKMNTQINKGEQDPQKLMAELETFKTEESLYKFEIPMKYHMLNSVKCLKERPIKGKLARFYDNSVVDIVDKKNTIRRIFPDMFEIWYYSNKDIQLKLSGNRLYFYYSKNKSYEFRFLNNNFLVYKFPNGQYEKHYFNNAKCIKFTDGSYRITQPTGEELIQLSDGTIHYSDKKGIKIIPKVQESA